MRECRKGNHRNSAGKFGGVDREIGFIVPSVAADSFDWSVVGDKTRFDSSELITSNMSKSVTASLWQTELLQVTIHSAQSEIYRELLFASSRPPRLLFWIPLTPSRGEQAGFVARPTARRDQEREQRMRSSEKPRSIEQRKRFSVAPLENRQREWMG